jgi:hypothetical protein
MNTMNEYYRETDVSIHKREQAKIGRLESIPVNDELSLLARPTWTIGAYLGGLAESKSTMSPSARTISRL